MTYYQELRRAALWRVIYRNIKPWRMILPFVLLITMIFLSGIMILAIFLFAVPYYWITIPVIGICGSVLFYTHSWYTMMTNVCKNEKDRIFARRILNMTR